MKWRNITNPRCREYQGDDKIQIEKMRIAYEERKHDKYIKLFENDKITFEQMNEMLAHLKS